MTKENRIVLELTIKELEMNVEGVSEYYSEYGSSDEARKLVNKLKKKLGEKTQEMNSINAKDEQWDIMGQYLVNMIQKTTKDNPVAGKINNTEHGNVRVVMFIEEDKNCA